MMGMVRGGIEVLGLVVDGEEEKKGCEGGIIY